MKLRTSEYLNSQTFESHIKRFVLGGQKAQARFAHHAGVCTRLVVEDLRAMQAYFGRFAWGLSRLYFELIRFIKSAKLYIDRLYVLTKNLYDLLNAFLKIASLLRDLCPDPDPEVLSVLNMSINELAQQINLEQTTYLTSALQFKDSVKVLETELVNVYKTLEPTIEAPADLLYTEDFINTRYSPYLELSINEIVDSLYGPTRPHG